jgi:uncharacterized membrane protein YeaQ/YmgE (transglycosylase-associated protein family)
VDRSPPGCGLVANVLISGRRSQGLVLACVIGVAGALLGGWVATKLFHFHSPRCRAELIGLLRGSRVRGDVWFG